MSALVSKRRRIVNAEDFDGFFHELHGVAPFAWQRRLARHIAEQGWPEVIDLPTSSGKTATLDIALFQILLETDKPPSERTAPHRIFFVVDRRLVVDEAFERARRIQDRLRQAYDSGTGLLAEAARRLLMINTDNEAEPLSVIRLRGGLPRERAFLRNPLQPAVVLSTVDQVGSRLLFRGYGVSENMRPIHAALISHDSLLIVDEAHLSRPFIETLESVKRYQGNAWAERLIGRPAKLVQMTATPFDPTTKAFKLANEDWDDPELSARLMASKKAELCTVKDNPEDPSETHDSLIELAEVKARSLMAETKKLIPAPVIGIVLNRVGTARNIFDRLSGSEEHDAILLTGRIRAYERDQLVKEYLPRIKANRLPGANTRPLYVVATQTVEAGADIDFDALLTELASIDALRQRFGRLNRLGRHKDARAAIIAVKPGRREQVDPVYGDALRKTFEWLEKQSSTKRGKRATTSQPTVIDFGIKAMHRRMGKVGNLTELFAPSYEPPVLMPAHVDMFVQTSPPPPAINPDVSAYLHGVNTEPEDVQIIWRSDLSDSLGLKDQNRAISTLNILPPVGLEALGVPVYAARTLLEGNDAQDIADVEGVSVNEESDRRRSTGRCAVRWLGADKSVVITADQVKPGDTIVVPTSYGGCDRFGWNLSFKGSVADSADVVISQQRGKRLLRVHPNLLPRWFEPDAGIGQLARATELLAQTLTRSDQEVLSEVCEELIEQLLALSGLNPWIRESLSVLRLNRRETIYPSESDPTGIFLIERRNVEPEFTDDDDASSLTREVVLENHCRGVSNLARSFAVHAGMDDDITKDVALAALLHDLGKADPRFQALLRGGIRRGAQGTENLLAKSSLPAHDLNALRAAIRQAGYPQGARHEGYSLAIALRNNELLDKAVDRELVLYLLATHHGRGRPLFPAVQDEGIRKLEFEFAGVHVRFAGTHDLEQLDQGWAERFWSLNRKYGYWGLTYLEALVRLADHRQSERGE
jgi:CRISPR-associated endonuclease/helicase Cas3